MRTCPPARAWASGSPGKAQSYKLVVDGDAIYVNGVLQKVKYDPDRDIAIRSGEAVLVPRGQGLALKPRPAEKP